LCAESIKCISIPTATYLIGSGSNFWIYEWDIIQILINNLGSPHFNIHSVNKITFHFELMIQSNLAVNITPPSTVNFTCSTLYNSTCDQQQATSSFALPINDLFYYSGTPLPAFSIIQNVPYCSSGTNVNLAVTPSVPSFTYLWSQGASTTNNINVTAFGNYTSTCASNVVVHHLVENNIINLSLTSNPSNSCAASSFYTLENSSDPGTGVVGQPLYSYAWSYSGGGCTTCSYPYTTPSGSGTGPFSVVASYNGCTAAASITIPNVTPSFTIIGGGNYCEPFPPTLSVNFGSYSPPAGSIVTYMWSTGATTPTINATAPKNGGLVNYSLTITVDGCSANANVDVINLTPEAVISFDDHMQGYCSASQINVHSLCIIGVQVLLPQADLHPLICWMYLHILFYLHQLILLLKLTIRDA
jgi:hypothetical protein